MDAECAQWATTTIVRLVAQIMKKCQWRVGEKVEGSSRGVGRGLEGGLEGGFQWGENPELGHAI